MTVKVLIPTPLQKFTNNEAEIKIEAGDKTITELINELEQKFPGIKERFYNDKGELRRFINFYVNSEDIRFLQNEKTVLKDKDEVSIVPAVAGG